MMQAVFGFGGRVAIMIPRTQSTAMYGGAAYGQPAAAAQPGPIQLWKARALMQGEPEVKAMTSFPGPLAGKPSSAVSPVLQRRAAECAASPAASASDNALLWRTLEVGNLSTVVLQLEWLLTDHS